MLERKYEGVEQRTVGGLVLYIYVCFYIYIYNASSFSTGLTTHATFLSFSYLSGLWRC